MRIVEKRETCFNMSLFFGGDKRDRTADLLTASQALSQLSYTPEPLVLCGFRARNIDKYNKIIAKCQHLFFDFSNFFANAIVKPEG